ncbi:MAG: hypothetical protein LBF58_12040 [Deltaproteobacteria bacterium]|nr:hypothetical protein [Deltaproteobacteria bacterium]
MKGPAPMPAFAKPGQDILWKAGIRLMIGWEGTGAREPLALIEELAPAGLVFFRRNYPPGGGPELADQMGELQRRSISLWGRPLLLAMDDEGGTVKRLPPPHAQLPGAPEQAGLGPGPIRAMARSAGAELRSLGFNLNLAPVLDLSVPGGIMSKRSYGEDPQTVIAMARAFIGGFGEAGLFTCAKHFPGLGAARVDPHDTLPTVPLNASALAPHLSPFRALIGEGLPMVMTSHCSYPGLGLATISTFSAALIDILRDDLGFGGLALSDDLEMGAVAKNVSLGEAASSAILAGHDLALVCRERALIDEAHRALSADAIDGHLKSPRYAAGLARLEAFLGGLPAP